MTTRRYIQLETDAYIDRRKRSITFAAVDSSSIAARVPHFWTFAGMLPYSGGGEERDWSIEGGIYICFF